LLPEAVIEAEGDVKEPRERADGWLEIELNSGDGINGQIDMSFKEIRAGHWKSGLIVQGIEVRVRPTH
jgi:Phloem protein 2